MKNRVHYIPINVGFLPGTIDALYSHHTGKSYFLKENSIHIYRQPGYISDGPDIPLNFTHEFGD